MDLGAAEDLAHDALLAALQQWPISGVPASPFSWLVTVGGRRFVDGLRRSARAGARDQMLLRQAIAEQGSRWSAWAARQVLAAAVRFALGVVLEEAQRRDTVGRNVARLARLPRTVEASQKACRSDDCGPKAFTLHRLDRKGPDPALAANQRSRLARQAPRARSGARARLGGVQRRGSHRDGPATIGRQIRWGWGIRRLERFQARALSKQPAAKACVSLD